VLSELLAKGLSDYAIGEKLRAVRLKKKDGACGARSTHGPVGSYAFEG